jgi:hypothetical protein
MKKLLIYLLLMATSATSAHAGIKVIGNGDVMELDTSRFPERMRAKYEIFRIKCTQCHSLERSIVAIQTGMAPISGGPFDSTAIKAYGVKMLRTSDMTKSDIKSSVEVLNFLLAEKEH